MVSRIASVFAVATPLLLAACDNSPSPSMTQPLRAGAEQSVPATKGLPPPGQHQYEPGIAADNEEKGVQVGALVAGKGGQQAQKEKELKVQAAADAEEARQRAQLARQRSADDKVSTE
jgi:hypothetical protein